MSKVINKIESKITAGKIKRGVEKLKNSSVEELTKQLEKVNKEDLRKKISELDTAKIKEMKINVGEIKKRLTPEDLEKIKKLAGKDSKLIFQKIDELS